MKIVYNKSYPHFLLLGILPMMLLWFIVLLICLNTTPIEILNNAKPVSYGVYTDQESNGNSIASVVKIPSKALIYSYVLKEGYTYPYTGISFTPDSGMFAFNSNSIFTVELNMETEGVIPFILNESVKDKTGKTSIRPVQFELKTKPGIHVYRIPLEEFAVPSWWYKNNQFSESDFLAINFSNIKNICIQNSALSSVNNKERITIKQISNSRDNRSWVWVAGMCSFCWIISYVAYWAMKKRETPVFIPYIATATDEKIIDEWAQIRRYISSNYMNDIDMEGMEKELGIAKHKIAVLIKENTTLIFKQYLNQIKVAEAKRLLLETNLPIGEIADQVGFGHLSNFNRVFKQYAGESPSDLRKTVK